MPSIPPPPSRLMVLLMLLTGAGLLAGCATTADRSSEDSDGATRHGALVLRNVPAVPDEVVARLYRYQNTRAARLHGWTRHGLLMGTRFAQTDQLHQVARPMGIREQLTFFDEPILAAFTTPANDEGFVYARDVGGSEFYQLFWFDWATRSHRLLTDGTSRYGNVVFSSSGESIAYYTTERNGEGWDVHVRRLDDDSVQVAMEAAEGAWSPLDFSPQDDRLLISRYVSINESWLFEVDLTTGEKRQLLPSDLRVAVGMAAYDADGTGVYFTSDLGAEFIRLHRLDLASGEIEVLTADVPWNVEAFTLSPDGSRLALSINEDGYSRISVWQLPGHRPLALPEQPQGVLTGFHFSPDGNGLAFSLATPTSPADIWAVSLTERTQSRWTRSEIGGLDRNRLADPELVSFPTFDQVDGEPRRIPAFLYRPPGPGPHPVLVYIHGGPEGQYRPRFSSTFQYLVGELGLAVVAPNVRGSNGYGKTYLKLDNGIRREDSVRDIGALLDWIGTREDLDADRVVVQGGSYGGYMVLASMVHYSDRLAAGIESVGISNFVTFLENTQPYRQDLRRAEYGDERDPEMRKHLLAISPLNHVEKITRPLMISQGANDPRVPASESEQIFSALQAHGVPVWYVLAEDEGHGFRKKANRDYNAAVMTLFLERHVLGSARREKPEYIIH